MFFDLYLQFPDNSMGLFLETKMGLRDSVEKSYDFDLDPNHFGPDRKCRNADLASRLLRDRAFVYLVCPYSLFVITH